MNIILSTISKLLQTLINFLIQKKSLKDIKRQDVLNFLDSKIKSSEVDPEKKWITTWNHYFNHLKFFFRWLYNDQDKTDVPDNDNDNRKSYTRLEYTCIH